MGSLESDDGFESFSRAIATDPIGLLLAQWRRDAFIRMLKRIPDVAEVIPSGSLGRGTQIGPVHDVDLIVVFRSEAHTDWEEGKSPEAKASVEDALDNFEGQVKKQLHPWLGAAGELGKETTRGRHVVTYNGDWSGPFRGIIPSAPPVDVMPAVRKGSHLVIPERDTGWISADPEDLIRKVEQRQREWKYFKAVVGMVKAWARLNNLKMKSLAIEVMVLQYCPRPRLFETMSVGDAVARFFKAAAKARITSLKDPAGRCGEIDPKMNFGKLRNKLKDAAVLAQQAMDAEHDWKDPHPVGEVIHPDVYWRKLFGKKYPRAQKRFWRPVETEPWFGMYTEPMGPPDSGGPNPPHGSGPSEGPRGPEGPRDGSGGATGRTRPSRPSGPTRPTGPAGPSPHSEPSGKPRPEPEPAGSASNLWTKVLGPAAASVPLTFG